VATSPSEIVLRFRVYLEPVDEDGEPLRPGSDMVRGDVVEVPLTLGYRQRPPGPTTRTPGGQRIVRAMGDTQANEDPRDFGSVTDPRYIPGYGVPESIIVRGTTSAHAHVGIPDEGLAVEAAMHGIPRTDSQVRPDELPGRRG
jgi:hypothetical protein